MDKERGEADQSGVMIDRRGLHGCDLVLSKAFANDLKPTRKWRISETSIAFSWERRGNSRYKRFFRVDELDLRLGQCRRNGADRLTGPVHDRAPWRAHRSSRHPTLTASLGFRVRLPPWRPPASGF